MSKRGRREDALQAARGDQQVSANGGQNNHTSGSWPDLATGEQMDPGCLKGCLSCIQEEAPGCQDEGNASRQGRLAGSSSCFGHPQRAMPLSLGSFLRAYGQQDPDDGVRLQA
ncbi:uncharacterized protein UV8b_06153 [Ustilaginoidea virens]|nr:uncharacterized protein UV8b_06153 [Ustilaginoidea virens]QUC21912.1 hypothetical protein UV8b_06153 [Ustilaginoidea virens]